MAEAKQDTKTPKILARCGEKVSHVWFEGAPHVFAGKTDLEAGKGGAHGIQTHPCGIVVDYTHGASGARSRVLVPWAQVKYATVAGDES